MFHSIVLAVIAAFAISCSSNKKIEPTATSAESTATKAVTEAKPAAQIEKATKATTKAATTSATSAKVECAVKGDTRILEIRGKGTGCELGYVKGGQEGIVASSSNGSSHCEKTMAKIKERLQGSGFTCQ